MNSRNFFEITGYLGQDAKWISSDKLDFVILNVAFQRGFYSKDTGAWVDQDPYWFEIFVPGKIKEKAKNLLKGEKVVVKGGLSSTTKEVEGKKYTFNKIVATNVEKIAQIEMPGIENIPNFRDQEEVHFEL